MQLAVSAKNDDGASDATPSSGAAYMFELEDGLFSETQLIRAVWHVFLR